MKFVTKEDLAAHQAATIRGAIEGTVAGFAISIPASLYAHRHWAYYRSLPLSLKALGIVIVTAPLYAVQAERRGVEYDKSTWTGAGVQELKREEAVQQSRWEKLSTTEKIQDWALRNQYKVILGSWAVSMGIAGAIVFRNRYQTPAQKIVQARMWAQGLTVGVLIGAGVLTHSQRVEAAQHHNTDHSWAYMLEEQAAEERAQKEQQQQQLSLPRALPASSSA